MNNYPPEYPAFEQQEYEAAKADVALDKQLTQLQEEIEDGQHDQALITIFHEDADSSMTKAQIVEALSQKLAGDAA